MRDWQTYVRERLGALRLEPSDAEEVAGELAGHLEECYEALRAKGVPEQEAFSQTCAQAGNWEELRRQVVSAKQEGRMSDRVRQIWLPSLVTLFASWTILGLLIWAGSRPMNLIRSRGERQSAILYVPWLVLLPLIGAVGAYMVRRAQGTGWRVYLAGAFPVLSIAAVFALTFPFAFVIDPQVVPFFKISSLVAHVVSWVFLPGMALCIGVALEGMRKPSGGVKRE